MADLVLDVEARGTTQAAAGLDKVSTAAAKTGSTWDAVKRKLGSGEVLRNAAASAALLGSGAGNATQKIAALGGALAAIPGPVGLVASGVAIAATVLDVFSKNAEAAEKAAAELAATLAGLGKQKLDTQLALAGKISGAAVNLGGDIRRASATGASAEGIAAAQALMPGNAKGALQLASQVAGANLTSEQQAKAQGTFADVRSMGFELSKEVVARIVEGIKYEAEAFAGEGKRDTTTREQESNRLGRVLDAIGADSATRGQMTTEANRSLFSQGGVAQESMLRLAEAPAVAAAAASVRDATAGGGSVAFEALKLATEKETTATDTLTTAIRDLTTRITAATPAKAPATSGWTMDLSRYSAASP